MSHLDRDPWVDVKTINGFQADHVISALQKEIRRGNVPDPLKRLNHLTKDLADGRITTAEFLKQAEKTMALMNQLKVLGYMD